MIDAGDAAALDAKGLPRTSVAGGIRVLWHTLFGARHDGRRSVRDGCPVRGRHTKRPARKSRWRGRAASERASD